LRGSRTLGIAVRRTLTLTGRGERMRASGPVERDVGQHGATSLNDLIGPR